MNSLLKRSTLAAGLVSAVVAALLLIPATYSVRVGTMITAEFNLPAGTTPHDIIREARSLNGGQSMISIQNGRAALTTVFKGSGAGDAPSRVVENLSARFPGIGVIDVRSEPILEQWGGNALAAVTGGRIEIGCEGMSDKEIEAAITGAMQARGLDVRQVIVTTSTPAEGQIERRIEIHAEADSAADLKEFDLDLGSELEEGGQRERVIVRELREDVTE